MRKFITNSQIFSKMTPLINLIPEKQLWKLNWGDCELDISFLCFEDIYQVLSNLIPKDMVVVDLGCYMAAQAFLFSNHAGYIGVDCYDASNKDYNPPLRFMAENTEHFTMSIEDFLESEDYQKLNLQNTYFICSAVPMRFQTWLIQKIIDKTVNVCISYPGIKTKTKGYRAETIATVVDIVPLLHEYLLTQKKITEEKKYDGLDKC